MNNIILEVKNLNAWFLTNESKNIIFHNVSFSLLQGEILGVFGPNGCGKTTLLRSIAGLHPYKEGTVEIKKEKNEASTISIIPQNYDESFFNWASLKTNILFLLGNPWNNFKMKLHNIEKTKEELMISIDLNLKPWECSGGMLQQAAIIRAFVNKPKLILADEPFSALDIEIARKVRKRFRKIILDNKLASIVILHDLEDMLDICDKILVIPGKLYTTDSKNRGKFSVAKVIKNPLLSTLNKEYEKNSSISFLKILQDVLEKKQYE